MVVTERDPGSIRETALSPVSATQTAPAPTVTPLGTLPTLTSPTLRLVSGLKRDTLLSVAFAIHRAPSPYAMEDAAKPAKPVAMTRFDPGSTRATAVLP